MYGLNGYLHYTSMGDAAFSATKVKNVRDMEGNSITMKRGQEITLDDVAIRNTAIATKVERGNYPKDDRVEITINVEGWHHFYGDVQGSISMKDLGFTELNEFMAAVAMFMEDSVGDSPME